MSALLDERLNSAAFVEALPTALLFSAKPYIYWAECVACGFRSADHDEGERNDYWQEWDPRAAMDAAVAEVEFHYDVTHAGVSRG